MDAELLLDAELGPQPGPGRVGEQSLAIGLEADRHQHGDEAAKHRSVMREEPTTDRDDGTRRQRGEARSLGGAKRRLIGPDPLPQRSPAGALELGVEIDRGPSQCVREERKQARLPSGAVPCQHDGDATRNSVDRLGCAAGELGLEGRTETRVDVLQALHARTVATCPSPDRENEVPRAEAPQVK